MLLLLACVILNVNSFEILHVENDISIEGGLVKVVSHIEVDSPREYFIHCVDPDYTVSSVTLNDETILRRSTTHFADKNCYHVPTNDQKFVISTTLLEALQPSPKVITQLQYQTLLLKINSVLYSPYLVRKQVTHINGHFIQHDLPSTYDSTNRRLTYGPISDSKPFSKSTVSALLYSNDPLLSISRYKRVIEISHWGYVNIRETVEVRSKAAKMDSFSRLDYTIGAQQAPSLDHIEVELPRSSSRIYFRDDIGNISTSGVDTRSLQWKVLYMYFRFPLISGWETQFEFGYQLPIHECVTYKSGKFIFGGQMMSLLFPNQVVDNFELEVVLPPHATDLQMDELPFEAKETHVGEYSAYLDLTSPRKTFVVKAQKLNPMHHVDIKISYKHTTVMLFVKPVVLSLVFLLLFVTMMVFERIDFSIEPQTKQEVNVHSCASSLVGLFEEMLALCTSAQGRVDAFKRSKEGTAFSVFRQEFEEKMKSAKQRVSTIEGELSSCERTDKLGVITKDVVDNSKNGRLQIDKLNGKLQQLFVNASKLVGNSMNGKDYSAFEIKNIKERDDIVKTVEDIINNL